MATNNEMAVAVAVAAEGKLAKLQPTTVLAPAQMLGYLTAMAPQIRAALPVSMKGSADHFARVLVTECSKNPGLAACTTVSLLGSLMTSAQLGLELGAILGQGYLVPYKNTKLGVSECQLQVGYRGYCVLAHRSNQVKAFFAHAVYEKDIFEFRMGSDPHVNHVPAYGDRGQPLGVYAVLRTVAGGLDIEWMQWSKIMSYKERYSKSAKGGSSPWQTSEEEMARKTVMRVLAKRAPVSLELAAAAGLDDLSSHDLPQHTRFAFAEAVPALAEDQSETPDKAAQVAAKVPGWGAHDEGIPE